MREQIVKTKSDKGATISQQIERDVMDCLMPVAGNCGRYAVLARAIRDLVDLILEHRAQEAGGLWQYPNVTQSVRAEIKRACDGRARELRAMKSKGGDAT